VDPAVGIELAVTRGQRVERGASLATLFVRHKDHADAVRERIRAAFVLGEKAEPVPRLVMGRVG
jgi:thymidine phosphorylase